MLERDLHQEQHVGAPLQRAALVLGPGAALGLDACCDVALALGGERRALALVVEVELLAAPEPPASSRLFSITVMLVPWRVTSSVRTAGEPGADW